MALSTLWAVSGWACGWSSLWWWLWQWRGASLFVSSHASPRRYSPSWSLSFSSTRPFPSLSRYVHAFKCTLTLQSIISHHVICPQILIFFLSLSMLCSLASQIFKAHPLILNYEHLNDSLEDPFHPIKKVINITQLPDGNITKLHEIIERAYPNTALLSMCLMFGCFFIAMYLRGFKTSVFLPGPVSLAFLSLPSLPFLF